MSTACVSQFYDLEGVLSQSHRARLQEMIRSGQLGSQLQAAHNSRKAGTPITGTHHFPAAASPHRQRQGSVGSASSSASSVGSSGMASPDRYSPPLTGSATSSQQGSPILGQRQPPSSLSLLMDHRKLDRSVSEPVGCPDNRNQQQQQPRGANINSSRYKTELCRPYEESGYCKYGDKCQFAHGGPELRSLARHPKYKTELCRTFHTTGFCPYGPRCHFIHNEDERRLNQINQLRHQTVGPSSPSPVPSRPKALHFSLSLCDAASTGRSSLGSTADSPPSSITDSPTMSPTFLGEDFLMMPPQSAPPTMSRAFSFSTALEGSTQCTMGPAGLLAPLNVQTCTDTLSSLAAGLQAASLNDHHNNNLPSSSDGSEMYWTPPSPPDSINGDSSSVSSLNGVVGSSGSSNGTCGSPLDVSRGLRLPIFSKLSCDL